MKGAVFLIVFILLAIPASAATFTVTNCASATTEGGALPWAVYQANGLTEPSIIDFNIPTIESGYTTQVGASFWEIVPTDSLIIVKNKIQIMGSTQSSNQGETNPYGPEIVIDASALPAGASALEISGCNDCTIEGLAITNSKSHGIHILSGNREHIYNCYLGVDAAGETKAGNAGDGIFIESSIGNLIGGGNLISGNGQNGIEFNLSTDTTVSNNIIGADRTRASDLGNGACGIFMHDVSASQYVAGGNILAFNGQDGIKLDGSGTNSTTLTQNSYFSNAGQGIKLANAANGSINYPTIGTSEYCSSLNLLYVQGEGPASSEIEIMKTAVPEDADERGEGKTSLGFGLSDGNGKWFTYLSTNEAQPGDKLCATATDNNGNTSEFSNNAAVVTGTTVYRPDAIIGTQADGSDYAGENIFNATGDGQAQGKTIYLGEASIYYLKIKNSGNISPDQAVISGTGNSTDWEISYYDSKTGSNEITSQITGSGWTTPDISSAESLEIKFIVKSLGTADSTKEVIVKAASASNSSRYDIVKATTSAVRATAPDRYSFTVSAPVTAEAGKLFPVTITAKNQSGQTTTEVSGKTSLAVDAGRINVTSIEAAQFADDGVWQGDISLSYVGNRTITITNDYISGTATFQIAVSVPPEVAEGGLSRFGPNPYSPLSGKDAIIWYWLNEEKETTAFIFNMQGELIFKKISIAGQPGGNAGINSVSWNGRNSFGEILENGVYLLKIAQGSKVLYNGKIIILK
ncbi:MAG: right-handed parallel beta-helix repeat-containing protein [Candidatus Margulisiibacteriota bacterium]